MSEVQPTEQDFWRLKKGKATPAEAGDTGKSLIREVELLREQVSRLTEAVRGLVQLQSVANQKLDAALNGKPTFDVL